MTAKVGWSDRGGAAAPGAEWAEGQSSGAQRTTVWRWSMVSGVRCCCCCCCLQLPWCLQVLLQLLTLALCSLDRRKLCGLLGAS